MRKKSKYNALHEACVAAAAEADDVAAAKVFVESCPKAELDAKDPDVRDCMRACFSKRLDEERSALWFHWLVCVYQCAANIVLRPMPATIEAGL